MIATVPVSDGYDSLRGHSVKIPLLSGAANDTTWCSPPGLASATDVDFDVTCMPGWRGDTSHGQAHASARGVALCFAQPGAHSFTSALAVGT